MIILHLLFEMLNEELKVQGLTSTNGDMRKPFWLAILRAILMTQYIPVD